MKNNFKQPHESHPLKEYEKVLFKPHNESNEMRVYLWRNEYREFDTFSSIFMFYYNSRERVRLNGEVETYVSERGKCK